MRPFLTVAIPTRQRPRRLAETLAALAAQEAPTFEVVVIVDGADAATEELLRRPEDRPFDLRWDRQPPSGPAAARNRAVRLARAERMLFLGDDTRPAPGALVSHLSADREVAVQGHVEWDPEAPITRIMHFLAPEGPQFYFKGLEDGRPIPYTAVLGSNLSAPTAWLREDPYDEGFPDAALEDTELAWRWQRKGRRAIYLRRALCWHHHHYPDLAPFLERQGRAGRAARYAVGRHPQMAWALIVRPTVFAAWVLLRHAARTFLGQRQTSDNWHLRCHRAYLRGLIRRANASLS